MSRAFKINASQIAVILLTAAVTYVGLSRFVPGTPATGTLTANSSNSKMTLDDRIQAVQAQAMPKALEAPAQGGPIIEPLPIETQLVPSSRRSRHSHRAHSRLKRRERTSAEASPLDLRSLGVSIEGLNQPMESRMSEEMARRLRLGLVPEAIVLPKKEEFEVSSLILVKHDQLKSAKD